MISGIWFLIVAAICYTIYKCLLLYYNNTCKHVWSALQTINVCETGHTRPYKTIYVAEVLQYA